MTPLGLHLRKLRKARGITQKEMARGINVSPAYLSAMEHGHRGIPSFDMLQRITGYLNIIWDEADTLQRLAILSDPRVVIDTIELSATATELANKLNQKIGTMSDNQMQELLQSIEKLSSQN